MTSVSYTIEEINSGHSYTTYTVIGICDLTQGQTLTPALSSAFKCSDVLNFADKDITQGTLFGYMQGRP